MKKGQGFTWKAPHHAYWEILIFLAGFIWLYHVPEWAVAGPIFVMSLGLVVVADDAVQHIVQLITGRHCGTPNAFHTPIHNLYWGLLNWLLTKTPPGSWQRRLLEWMRTV
jgi:hypothetical protein